MQLEKLLLATNNPQKEKELRRLIGRAAKTIYTFNDFNLPSPEEDGETYEDNAQIKAEDAFIWTGLPTLADDSGIEVEELENGPGVLSARYEKTDSQRIQRMLTELNGKKNRKAAQICVLAFIHPNTADKTYFFRHDAVGSITLTRKGQEGFGYDSIFELGDKTFGELDEREKDLVSHRGVATRKFLSWLLAQEDEKSFGKDASILLY